MTSKNQPASTSAASRHDHRLMWSQFVAGAVAGGTAVVLLHPLDLLKTRFQATFVNDRILFDLRRQSADLYKAGWPAMYRGFTANLAGSTVSWGLYFLLYRWMKTWWPQQRPPEVFVSAAMAGMLTVLVANPLWMAKTRICQPGSRETSLVRCLKSAWRAEGIRGLYRGLLPGLFGTSHGAVQFVVYEELKRRQRQWALQRPPTATEFLLMSSISKVAASVVTYPYQVIRCRTQLADTHFDNIRQIIKQTWRNEGARGFYKGIVPSTVRVLPGTTITFLVYEKLSSYLGHSNR